MQQFASVFETTTGTVGEKSHVPLAMMRILALALWPLQPALARQIQADVVRCDYTKDLPYRHELSRTAR